MYAHASARACCADDLHERRADRSAREDGGARASLMSRSLSIIIMIIIMITIIIVILIVIIVLMMMMIIASHSHSHSHCNNISNT